MAWTTARQGLTWAVHGGEPGSPEQSTSLARRKENCYLLLSGHGSQDRGIRAGLRNREIKGHRPVVTLYERETMTPLSSPVVGSGQKFRWKLFPILSILIFFCNFLIKLLFEA